jgi:hypothetical protein
MEVAAIQRISNMATKPIPITAEVGDPKPARHMAIKRIVTDVQSDLLVFN